MSRNLLTLRILCRPGAKVLLLLSLLVAGLPLPMAAQHLRPGCEAVAPRSDVHSITEVFDIVALRTNLSTIAFLREGGADSALVFVSYDSTGALSHTRFSHRDAPEVVTERIEEIVRRHATPTATPSFSAYGLIPRGENGQLLPLVVQRQCEPLLTNRAELVNALRRQPQTHGARAVVWVLLGVDGRIQDARIEQSSGSVPADAAFVAIARLAVMEPASINGYPVPVWVSLPLQAQAGRRR